jgi:hypothetical protein
VSLPSGGESMAGPLRVEVVLSPEAVETIATEVTRRVLVELREEGSEGRWLTGAKAAADYLGCSPKRVYARLPEIPHVRGGGRLMFNTHDLDEWLRRL